MVVNTTFNGKWDLLTLFGGVIEFTKLNYYQIMEMPIVEFLNLVVFVMDKNEYENELRKKYLKS